MLRGHTHPETNQGVKSRGQTRNRADMKQVTHTKWLFPASMRCLHALRWTDGRMDSRGQQSFNIKDCMLDTTRTNSPGLVDIVILNYVLTFVCIYFAKYVIFLVSTWPQALCNSSDFSWRMFFFLFFFSLTSTPTVTWGHLQATYWEVRLSRLHEHWYEGSHDALKIWPGGHKLTWHVGIK